MKKAFEQLLRLIGVTSLLAMNTIHTTGQSFDFSTTFIPLRPEGFDVPVTILDPTSGQCVRPEGDAWHLQVFAGPVGTPVQSLTPLVTTSFLTGQNAGRTPLLELYATDVQPYETASVFVRVYSGPDFLTSPSKGEAGPFFVQVGPGTEGRNLPLLTPGSLDFCVPEPQTTSLVVVALGVSWAFWVARRRAINKARVPPIIISSVCEKVRRRGFLDSSDYA